MFALSTMCVYVTVASALEFQVLGSKLDFVLSRAYNTVWIVCVVVVIKVMWSLKVAPLEKPDVICNLLGILFLRYFF